MLRLATIRHELKFDKVAIFAYLAYRHILEAILQLAGAYFELLDVAEVGVLDTATYGKDSIGEVYLHLRALDIIERMNGWMSFSTPVPTTEEKD